MELTLEQRQLAEDVLAHLIVQGRRSVALDGSCLYRGPENTKCAVGALIPDEMYDQKMERNGILSLVEMCKIRQIRLPKELSDPENLELLSSLQRLHDNENIWDSPAVFEGAVRATCVLYGLYVAEITRKARGDIGTRDLHRAIKKNWKGVDKRPAA